MCVVVSRSVVRARIMRNAYNMAGIGKRRGEDKAGRGGGADKKSYASRGPSSGMMQAIHNRLACTYGLIKL